jgi:DNA-binding XRE family transcriptional regulator
VVSRPDPTLAAGAAEVRWAPRVPPHLIRRLYETDARGIVDGEQIDAVGYALYARCRSILRATEAHAGRVTCPRCEATVERREPFTRRRQVLRCDACGWATTWGAYFATYHRRLLRGGSAVDAFGEFAERFPAAQTPQARMLAIDRLLHSFHHQLTGPTRPAGVNLIEGSLAEVLAFLDDLTYGPEARGAPPTPTADRERRDLARTQLARARLGDRLRHLRRGTGLTGHQLGRRVGKSQSRISQIETGRVTPSVAEVEGIAVALGLAPDEIDALVDQARRLPRGTLG